MGMPRPYRLRDACQQPIHTKSLASEACLYVGWLQTKLCQRIPVAPVPLDKSHQSTGVSEALFSS